MSIPKPQAVKSVFRTGSNYGYSYTDKQRNSKYQQKHKSKFPPAGFTKSSSLKEKLMDRLREIWN